VERRNRGAPDRFLGQSGSRIGKGHYRGYEGPTENLHMYRLNIEAAQRGLAGFRIVQCWRLAVGEAGRNHECRGVLRRGRCRSSPCGPPVVVVVVVVMILFYDPSAYP